VRDKKPVLPGERLALIEEFGAGKNVYVNSDSNIRPVVFGVTEIDRIERRINVMPLKTSLYPKEGKVVVGIVDEVHSNFAVLKIPIGDARSPKGLLSAIVFISRGRGRERNQLLGSGDIVKGKVAMIKDGLIFLDIRGSEFGVVYARCRTCGALLVKYKNKAYCKSCRKFDARKLAEEFKMVME